MFFSNPYNALIMLINICSLICNILLCCIIYIPSHNNVTPLIFILTILSYWVIYIKNRNNNTKCSIVIPRCHSCPKKNWVKSAVFSRKPLVFFFTPKLYHKAQKNQEKKYLAAPEYVGCTMM